jgi:hypothetical protein
MGYTLKAHPSRTERAQRLNASPSATKAERKQAQQMHRQPTREAQTAKALNFSHNRTKAHNPYKNTNEHHKSEYEQK